MVRSYRAQQAVAVEELGVLEPILICLVEHESRRCQKAPIRHPVDRQAPDPHPGRQ